ncbi:helix-turn-helix domain-containing protein [Streptomyces sp. NPDC059639]|uniref:helix-turn-helix domain-containing protein n=1 Tax=Streptomyces sp. NPDC059639 TaxID=3346891 RepID=UPI0036916F5E
MSAVVRLAGNLIEARIEMGESQRGLARICGMDYSTISRIESADRVPSALHLAKMLNAFKDAGLEIDLAKWAPVIEEGAQCVTTPHPDGLRVALAQGATLTITPDLAAALSGRNWQAQSSHSRRSVAGMPTPRGIRTKGDLCDAMVQMWEAVQGPSPRTMAKVVLRHVMTEHDEVPVPDLGKSTFYTMHRSLHEDRVVPRKVDNFRAWVVGCGQAKKLAQWTDAYHRAMQAPEPEED